ncbi:MerC domain-containing protein [Alteromonas pelagimontana]|uniref:MerC domain-containing protein n=1 Tax=Alteromonas pelagimontana TaxID=1858656 RepID=A0A6M4MDI7_9ALTE|nr:MerC domain-containing protein [Alteromonas pelagimontana]QJR81087.1 MerC domain-containing protein [Alteromonas pelagimontana]
MKKLQLLGDKFAIFLSSLCIVHCLLFPIILVFLPPLAGLIAVDHDAFHQLLLFFVIPVGLIALTMGYLHHRNIGVFMIGLTGLVFLGSLSFIDHEALGEPRETIWTVIASCTIAFGHIRNYQLRRQHACAPSDSQVPSKS